MELSSVPSRLLTPSSKPSAQGYFAVPTQRDSIPRGGSPSDDMASSTYLSPSVASPSCASTSDLCSVTSNGSVESYHLTPPLSLPDYEKPPYKARSESAASLNMLRDQGDVPQETEFRRAKTRRCKRKHRKRPATPCQQLKSAGNESHSLQYFPGYEGDMVPPMSFAQASHARRDDFLGQNGIAKMNDNKKGTRPAQLMSALADVITTRRWSSVGIGDPLPKAVTRTSIDGMEKTFSRSKTWDASDDKKVISAIRDRLTLREVSISPPPKPMAITLSRAEATPGDDTTGLSGATIGGAESLIPEQDQADKRRPSSTYLITLEDIDSVMEMIQSRLALQPKESKMEGEGCWRNFITKTTFPPDFAPPKTSKRAKVAQQATEALQEFSKRLKRPSLKRVEHKASKLSRTFGRNSVQEVIWEHPPPSDYPGPGSPTSSSSSSISEAMADPSTAEPPGHNATSPEETSSPAASAEEFSRRISAQGDTSPTSRVFKWVFKEPLKEDGQAKDKSSDEDARETLARWKLPKISPPTISWKSLEKQGTPTVEFPEVLSFPPLFVRKSTVDWISLLPDISAPVVSAPAEQEKGKGRCLYDAGIDARTGTHKSSVASLPELSTQLLPANDPRHSLKSSKSNIEVGRKSSVSLRPQLAPRTGEPFTIGNKLGVSSGARRKSSSRSVRIKIDIDALDRHPHSDGSSWIKPRKDSGWPAYKLPTPEPIDSRKASALSPLQIMTGLKGEQDKSKRTAHNRPTHISGGLAPPLGLQGVHNSLTSARADAVVSPVLGQGHGCGASDLSARMAETDWCE